MEKKEAWNDLKKVHAELKSKFNYTSDMALYGKSEFWAILNDEYQGDCEDAALTWRKILIEKGWKKENIRPACCWTETGGYHAVLVAYIDSDSYVLDNRQSEVLPWADLPYAWDKILSKSGDSWVKIND